MTLASAERHTSRIRRNVVDWRDEAPPRGRDRIDWLRGEAAAMISEARDLETRLEFPPMHECVTCEHCRLAIIAEAQRMHYA